MEAVLGLVKPVLYNFFYLPGVFSVIGAVGPRFSLRIFFLYHHLASACILCLQHSIVCFFTCSAYCCALGCFGCLALFGFFKLYLFECFQGLQCGYPTLIT